MREKLYGLGAFEFQHPADKAALDILKKTPGFETFCKFIVDNGVETYYKILFMGNSLKITPQNAPGIHRIMKDVCDILCVDNVPELYLQRNYKYTVTTVGYTNPMVIVDNLCLEEMNEDELYFLFGQSVAGIKTNHAMFYFFADIVNLLGSVIPFADVLKYPFYHWKRKSQLTNDRGSLLACQNYEAAMKSLMLYSGAPHDMLKDMSIDGFMEQAVKFKNFDDSGLSKIGKTMMTLSRGNAWYIERAAELFNWYETGQYEDIIVRHS